MPTLTPDNTPSDVAYASRQGQPAPVSPALAHQLALAEFAALKTQLAAQAAEIAELKSQLATREAGTAAPESAIPQSAVSSPQSEISNLKSAIPDSHTSHSSPSSHSSQIPHSAFPIPHSSNPAFAPLYAREVKHYLPGGDWIMPPIASAALTRQAHIQRLNYLSTRCELALIERVDRFAVCGIVGPPEGETFAFIMHHLARLTSIYKSITALENDPTIPVGPVAEDLTNLATSIMRDPAKPAQSPSAFDKSPSPAQSEILNLKSEISASPSSGNRQSANPVISVQSDGSSLPHSEIPNQQSNNPQSKGEDPVGLRDHNPQSAAPAVPSTPAAPGVPVIREVPQCPTYSPERLVRTLDQTATALDVSSAGILPAHSATSANPQPPSPTLGARTPSSATPATVANPHTPSSTKSPSPSPSQSEILNLKSEISDPPCPKAADPAAPRPQCTECDAELCPSRIAVPIFTGVLKRTQKCDGACRFCSPKRQHTCPYTLPRFRASPAA